MITHQDPTGQPTASSAGIMELSASVENSSYGIQNTALTVPGNNDMRMDADKSEFSVYDLLSEMQDGDISSDDIQRLDESFREELDILAQEDELIAGIIAGDRVICTVLGNEVSMTHRAFSLRLCVIGFDHHGAPVPFDVVRLPMAAPDVAAESRLIYEMVEKHIAPLAHKLAELYGPRLDASVQVAKGSEANA